MCVRVYIYIYNPKKIMTLNGQFPEPTLYTHKGGTIIVDVDDKANYNMANITLQSMYGTSLTHE